MSVIDFDSEKLDKMCEVQSKLSGQTAKITGSIAGIEVQRDFVEERRRELSQLVSDDDLLATEFDSFLSLFDKELNEQIQQLTTASAAMKSAKTFLNDLLR